MAVGHEGTISNYRFKSLFNIRLIIRLNPFENRLKFAYNSLTSINSVYNRLYYVTVVPLYSGHPI